ncbi:MAG: hypothetical protein AB1489_40375 [Acidobacteriota bacterium]
MKSRLHSNVVFSCTLILGSLLAIATPQSADNRVNNLLTNNQTIDPLTSFTLPSLGCPMAHCDPRMSDRNLITAPAGPVNLRWRDMNIGGALTGLGCASNGSTVVCALTDTAPGGGAPYPGPYIIAFDGDGNRRWDSGNIINSNAWTSAPMLDNQGGAIVTDDTKIVRFDTKGNVLWNSPTPGGLPISPTITNNGAIVLATKASDGATQAPVSAYNPATGELLGILNITDKGGFYETLNTPGGRNNRVYISTQRRLLNGDVDPSNTGQLFAVEIDVTNPNPTQRLQVKWSFEYRSPSGASPLVINDVIYFDGAGLTPGTAPTTPYFFAVRDTGNAPVLVWARPLNSKVPASAAQDPRGGLWVIQLNYPYLLRLHETNGSILQVLNIDQIVNEPGSYIPSSAMSITGTNSHPVMIVSAIASFIPDSPRILAIDLTSVLRPLRWKYPLDCFGQYPVLKAADGSTVVVFATVRNGVAALSTVQ